MCKQEKRRLTTQQLTKVAISAAIYFIMSMVFKPFAFGQVEFRISEMMNFLMFIDPIYIIGITLGCAITNFFTFGLMDVFFGSLATFITGCVMWKCKRMWVGIIPGVLGCSIIAWELSYFFGLPFMYNFITGGIGEFISLCAGYILARRLFKEKKIINLLKVTPGNDKNVLNVK